MLQWIRASVLFFFVCLFLIRLVFTSDLECCILDPAANGAWKKIQSLKSSVLGNLSLLHEVLFQAFEHHVVNQPHSSNLKKFSQTSVPVPSFYFYFDWQTWRRLAWSFQSQLEVRLWCSLHLYNFCVCVNTYSKVSVIMYRKKKLSTQWVCFEGSEVSFENSDTFLW